MTACRRQARRPWDWCWSYGGCGYLIVRWYHVARRCTMTAFSQAELSYLTEDRRLGRIATVGKDGTPHVAPVGFAYNREADTVDIQGYRLSASKKFKDVHRTGRAAIVVDDLASVDPWRPRGVEVRGRAEAITEPAEVIRIHPDRIVSWGLD